MASAHASGRPLQATGDDTVNPSIAGKVQNDPTARRGIGFATSLDCSDLIFVNAATAIATDAKNLDPNNLNCRWSDWALQEAARLATESGGYLVAAWGGPKGKADVQRKMLERFNQIRAMGLPLKVLRLTPKGYPERPLYLPGNLTPREWTI